jgi:hypothetical protein
MAQECFGLTMELSEVAVSAAPTAPKLRMNQAHVCLYSSQMATNQFRDPIGWSPAPTNPYYKPPTRLWSFDPNFSDPARLPPGTPAYTLP